MEKMDYYTSIEEAIKNGDCFYWDQEGLNKGRSGGSICPKCRKWSTPHRKRKNETPTWINDCNLCEIKDPFQRLWHKFNSNCNDAERQMYNKWLAQVTLLLEKLETLAETPTDQMKLRKLIYNLPFFEGI